MSISKSSPDIRAYAKLMKELKYRMEVLNFFTSGKGHALYQPSTVECCYLQLRKMLELVAFGSLIANKDVYATAYTNFAKHWHAGRLLRDLEKVNPDFYPKPVFELPTNKPGVKAELKDRGADYLTKDDFVRLYDDCGTIMHARNPYGQPIDYEAYGKQLSLWQTRIVNLLNSHRVHLTGHSGFYLVHMKEPADDEAHYYEFTPGGSMP